MKGVHRFGIRGKLVPRYVGPFQIQQRNFEMIQMLKCTPNSNFKIEAEFQNVH